MPSKNSDDDNGSWMGKLARRFGVDDAIKLAVFGTVLVLIIGAQDKLDVPVLLFSSLGLILCYAGIRMFNVWVRRDDPKRTKPKRKNRI